MRTVKSNAKRQNVGLTIQVATRQARKIVDQVMPGAGATVESKGSHDLATDTALIITHITFPRGHAARHLLVKSVAIALDPITVQDNDSSITITRKK